MSIGYAGPTESCRPAQSRGFLALLAGSILLCGCPDPNIYGTPRTLAPGDWQLQASVGGFGGTASGHTGASPTPPTIGVRVGVADRVDIGVRVVDFGGAGFDAKLNMVRGRLDIAIDPMVQGFVVPHIASLATQTTGVAQFHVPLLIGVNFDEATELTLTPGFVATLATPGANGSGVQTDEVAFATSGLGGRLGLGLNIHSSDRVAWGPEITVLHEFNEVSSWTYVVGIGIGVGAQPDYSDLAPQ